MCSPSPRNLTAFTLVEILIVVVVISIMGSFVLGNFGNTIDQGRAKNVAKDMKIFKRAMKNYYLKNLDAINAGASLAPERCQRGGSLRAYSGTQKKALNDTLNISLGASYDIACMETRSSGLYTYSFHAPSLADEKYVATLEMNVDDYFQPGSNGWAGSNALWLATCPDYECN